MLLVPVRQYLLPMFFKGPHLQDLDAAEYEETPAVPFHLQSTVTKVFSFLILRQVKKHIKLLNNVCITFFWNKNRREKLEGAKLPNV